MKYLILMLMGSGWVATAQPTISGPSAGVFNNFLSSLAVTSVPPTNLFSFAQGNYVPGSTANNGNLPENMVYDSVSGLFFMPASTGTVGTTNVAIWTNGVDISDPTKWGRVSNYVLDVSVATPSPCLVVTSNAWSATAWYLYYSRATNVNVDLTNMLYVASNTTPWGPFTNARPIIVGPATWERYRICESFAFPRAGGWTLLYMGDAGPQGQDVETVGYATATNPDGPFTEYASNPLIPLGSAGQFDSKTVADPWAYNWNGTYYIGAATGTNNFSGPPWYTGLYSTTDFVSFTKLHQIISAATALNAGGTNAFRGGPPLLSNRKYVMSVAVDGYQIAIAAAPSDLAAPTLTNVSGLGFVTNSVVTFETDIPANCGLALGASSGVYTSTNAEVTSYSPGTWGAHTLKFDSTAGTTYYALVLATNTAVGGAVAVSAEQVIVGNAWNPTNRANIKLVYDVNLLGLSTPGTTISTLTDFGPNAWDAKSTGSPWVTNSTSDINNHSYTRLNGTSQNYKTNFTALSQPTTVYMLFRPFAIGSQGSTFPFFFDSAAGGTARESFYENVGSSFISQYAGTDTTTTATPGFTWQWVELQYNGASSFTKMNGTNLISGNPGAQTMGGIILGENAALSQFGKMDLAFFAVVGAANSAAESASWRTYAISRFGNAVKYPQ